MTSTSVNVPSFVSTGLLMKLMTSAAQRSSRREAVTWPGYCTGGLKICRAPVPSTISLMPCRESWMPSFLKTCCSFAAEGNLSSL